MLSYLAGKVTGMATGSGNELEPSPNAVPPEIQEIQDPDRDENGSGDTDGLSLTCPEDIDAEPAEFDTAPETPRHPSGRKLENVISGLSEFDTVSETPRALPDGDSPKPLSVEAPSFIHGNSPVTAGLNDKEEDDSIEDVSRQLNVESKEDKTNGQDQSASGVPSFVPELEELDDGTNNAEKDGTPGTPNSEKSSNTKRRSRRRKRKRDENEDQETLNNDKDKRNDIAVEDDTNNMETVDSDEPPSKRLKRERRKSEEVEAEENEGIYRVERILGWRLVDGQRLFGVKWEGYDTDHDTWEPIENLSGNEKFSNFLKDVVLRLDEQDESGLVQQIKEMHPADLKKQIIDKGENGDCYDRMAIREVFKMNEQNDEKLFY